MREWGVMVVLAITLVIFVLGAVTQTPALYALGCWVAALGVVFIVIWSDDHG